MKASKGHSLSRVLQRVATLFEEQISPHEVWIKAEISSLKKHSSGHIYFDLVEQHQQRIIARCKAALWRGQVDLIQSKSQIDLRSTLEDGREILCLCRITYHEVHGLSLHVLDVDKSFALGEVEKRRLESIAMLQKAGLIGLNRLLPMPRVIQRIALIASEGSAGLADFINQIDKNSYGFKFTIEHFTASVQGEGSVNSLVKAFDAITTTDFDAIVIIRGGGAALDLDVFNNYNLNAHMATSTLPVLVGIGHETDRTVMDEWAAKSLKTPSAVGAWIVERVRDFEIDASTTYQSIVELYRTIIDRQKNRHAERSSIFVQRTVQYLQNEKHQLEGTSRNLDAFRERATRMHKDQLVHRSNQLAHWSERLTSQHRYVLGDQSTSLFRSSAEIRIQATHQLKLIEELIGVYRPESTLQRGYAYLRKGDEIVPPGMKLAKDDSVTIETHLQKVTAIIQNTEDKNGEG